MSRVWFSAPSAIYGWDVPNRFHPTYGWPLEWPPQNVWAMSPIQPKGWEPLPFITTKYPTASPAWIRSPQMGQAVRERTREEWAALYADVLAYNMRLLSQYLAELAQATSTGDIASMRRLQGHVAELLSVVKRAAEQLEAQTDRGMQTERMIDSWKRIDQAAGKRPKPKGVSYEQPVYLPILEPLKRK